MRRILFLALLVFVVASPLRLGAITPAQPEFRKLADDVYVYIGKLNDANAMVVVTTQGVVLVDTVGMRLRVLYEQQKEWNEVLEIQVEP